MTRRDHGSGSIYQDERGRWVGSIEAGLTRTGSRRRIKVVRATKTEAQRALRAKVAEIERSGIPELTSTTTVKTWAEQWIKQQVRELRPKTAGTYLSEIKNWIIPTIGHKRLSALSPADVRTMTNTIRNAGRSTSTARHVNAVLTSMLRDAIAEGHPVPPRLLHMDAPARAVHDRAALDLPIARAVLAVAATRTDGSRWVAALLQGMRQGECLGLTWDALDLDAGTADVSWQLQALVFEHGCGGECKYKRAGSCPQRRHRVPDGYEVRPVDGALCLVRPKTASGKRIIPLVPWIVAALRDWQRRAPVSPAGLVWPRPDGRPRLASDDLEDWKALQTPPIAAHPSGRPWLLHEARHTCATLLLGAGVDPHTVTAILGHSSIITSRGYQTVSTALSRQALDAVAAQLQLD